MTSTPNQGIFANEKLLHAIQMARLYPDSKTFVDKKLRFPPEKIEENFNNLWNNHEGAIPRESLLTFVDDNFENEGLELEAWTPKDWISEPSILQKVKNERLINLAKGLNEVWKELSRKIKDEVQASPELYSIIFVPNGFVVPGGRFREFYYWDTFWIIKALLLCDMIDTVKGIIENFMMIIERYGLVPNGGRIYYIHRSQPPLLTAMVKEYMKYRNDIQFLRKCTPIMEKEMEFWETFRSIDIVKDGHRFHAYIYGSCNHGPRPESYWEDVELSKAFDTKKEKEEFFKHMRAGAESGWDYSSRWIIDGQRRNIGGLKEIRTNSIAPVDLNCIMFMNYKNLEEFHKALGNRNCSKKYQELARNIQKTIDNVFWCKNDEMWYDFDTKNQVQRKYFYPSNLFPLWVEAYNSENKQQVARASCKYLERTNAISYSGGVPTSLVETGQQWDFPNVWPPLQHILVEGLLKTGDPEARNMALTIARRYTNATMFTVSKETKLFFLFEKYNADISGQAGQGGEYEVQTGFGWSNGVVIDFINMFGDELLPPDADELEMDAPVLITQFDLRKNQSLIIRRDSNSAVGLSELLNFGRASSNTDPVEFHIDLKGGESEEEISF